MEVKIQPNQIWNEYHKLQEYLTSRNLYEIVKTNENFYDGKQWEGVNAESMPKPVVNILQRVVKYMVATISSNEIAISINPFSSNPDDVNLIKPICSEVEKVIEIAKIKESAKLAIRNGAVDGSSYMMQLFNPEIETKQPMKGMIENVLVDNTNVYFGNPYSSNIQKQPFIIIAMRQHFDQVKHEAEINKVSQEDIENIKPDSDTNQLNDDSSDLCTVLIKYYKKFDEKIGKSTVWFTKTTEKVTIITERNLGYSRYPISCFGWDPIKNSYLYNSPLTSVIPNQIFINKCFAIAQMYGLQSAFPKIIYDKNKVEINRLLKDTSPNAVVGIDVMGKFLDFIKIPDFSNNILELLDKTIVQTKECMGVNDASLGNVKPDNTSAIIALQEASNVPLEIQRQEYYEFWEDTVRNILDIMANSYGTRNVLTEVNGQNTLAIVNFEMLNEINYDLHIDIGNSAQFSEIAQINTLDKLFQSNIIDPKTYIESIPSKYIPNKGKISQSVDNLMKQEQSINNQNKILSLNNGSDLNV